MATLLDLIVALLTSVVRLVVVFTTEVALRQPIDPLALISLAAGTVFVVVSVGFFGYLVVGALFEALGVDLGSPGRSPPPEHQ
jgi:energy-converting hydrogenase Eha subunit C